MNSDAKIQSVSSKNYIEEKLNLGLHFLKNSKDIFSIEIHSDLSRKPINLLKTPIEKKTVCNKCDFKCKYHEKLVEHMNLIHGASITIEKNHLKKSRNYKPREKTTCDDCNFKAQQHDKLIAHKNIKHGTLTSQKGLLHAGFLFICLKCGLELIRTRTMTKHIKTHDKSRNYCTICEYSTKRKDLLAFHIEREHGEVKSYDCSKCKYFSNNKPSLRTHVRQTHENEGEKYDCFSCDYTTNRKTYLSLHVKKSCGRLKRKKRSYTKRNEDNVLCKAQFRKKDKQSKTSHEKQEIEKFDGSVADNKYALTTTDVVDELLKILKDEKPEITGDILNSVKVEINPLNTTDFEIKDISTPQKMLKAEKPEIKRDILINDEEETNPSHIDVFEIKDFKAPQKNPVNATKGEIIDNKARPPEPTKADETKIDTYYLSELAKELQQEDFKCQITSDHQINEPDPLKASYYNSSSNTKSDINPDREISSNKNESYYQEMALEEGFDFIE